MFSFAHAATSLSPFPITPMDAMLILLFRFFPRTRTGTPKASAPAASEVAFMKSRRLHWDVFLFWCFISNEDVLASQCSAPAECPPNKNWFFGARRLPKKLQDALSIDPA